MAAKCTRTKGSFTMTGKRNIFFQTRTNEPTECTSGGSMSAAASEDSLKAKLGPDVIEKMKNCAIYDLKCDSKTAVLFGDALTRRRDEAATDVHPLRTSTTGVASKPIIVSFLRRFGCPVCRCVLHLLESDDILAQSRRGYRWCMSAFCTILALRLSPSRVYAFAFYR
jgi:hypothetical protein